MAAFSKEQWQIRFYYPREQRMILTTDDAHVRTLTLNRPDAMNAFNGQQFDDLTEALLAAQADTAVRVVVLTGTGRAFTTGLDLANTKPCDHVV